MLAVLGVLVGEAVTGVAWQDAGLYEATNGATYWGNPLPFTERKRPNSSSESNLTTKKNERISRSIGYE